MPQPPEPTPDFGGSDEDVLASRLFPPLPGTVVWGLDRTRRILEAVGDPHHDYEILHVGGTNGKGSVARLWAGIFRASGRRVGLYTSPHLVSFRERILVDGSPLPDELLEGCAADLRAVFEQESPSFFEAATALAFLAFSRAGAEVVAVEVGLGGRLDATNVVSPLVTAVTNVTMEHSAMLGGTVAAIAGEKAGIFKAAVPAFTSSENTEVLAVFDRVARDVGATIRAVACPRGRTTLDGSRLRVTTERWGEIDLASPLVGAHQLRNIALAVRSLDGLPDRIAPDAAAIVEGVLRTRVPGRFQVERAGDRTWIFDAAHNPAGAEALASTLLEVGLPGPRVAVLGVLSDKDAEGILHPLDRAVDHLILTIPGSAPASRQWDPTKAARLLAADRCLVIPDLGQALDRADALAGPAGTIVCAGSMYTIGDAMRRLGWIPREALPPSFDSG